MALSNARSATKNCTKKWCLNFLVIRSGLALSLFAKPLLYVALIVLSCLLAITPPALAQTAPSLDANGWTVFTPVSGTGSCSNASGTYTGTCIVYVSSSGGSDTTCAAVIYSASSFTPCATLAHAQTLMRNGHPDWLLLKRGDTFTPDTNGNNFGQWKLSGASATEPMVIGSYDPSQPGVVDPYVSGARPKVENAYNVGPFGTSGSTGGDYLAIVGLEFYNYTEDPGNGSYNPTWVATTGLWMGANTLDWLLIEDCKFSFYQFNIDIEPANNSNPNASTSVFTFNRNVVIDAYSASAGNSSGMYVGTSVGNSVVANSYLTGNIFDHNGWNATVSGAGPSTHNHNLYMECATSGVQPANSYETIEDNIFTNDSEAPQFRLPGTYTGNLFAYVPNGFVLGASASGTAASCTNPPTTQTATNNVILNTNFNSAAFGGGGFGTLNLTSPANITNNIISGYASTNLYGYALQINTPNADNVFTNNTVWDWANLAQDNGGTGDVLTPNNYNCTTCYNGSAYPDPYRNLGSYYATLPSPVASASVTGTINNCSPSCSGSTTAGNVMNVTAVGSGTLNVGDAITFPGQNYSVVITGNANIGPNLCGGSSCTGNGGTGTYAVNIAINNCTSGSWSSCGTRGAIPMLVSSQTLTDYSPQNLITAEHSQSKSNWNAVLAASAINAYIQAGFGIKYIPVPSGLAAVLASATSVNLSWNASTGSAGVAGYNVFRNGTQIGTTPTTSYQDTGLSLGTTYSYTVSAYTSDGSTSARSLSVSISTPSPLTHTHDFNGDGKSDILWRDTAGDVGLWLMNGTQIIQGGAFSSVPLNWSVVGQRDLTGNGNANILWQDTSGHVGIWLMSGTTLVQGGTIGTVPTSWSIIGTGDFNRDGKADILWRDTSGNVGIWFMNGASVLQTAIVGNMPTAWTVVGADMKGDIFWRNTTTGEFAVWVMNGTTIAQSVSFGLQPLSWKVTGIGDFDGNGSEDILWRDTSGDVAIWLMNGTKFMSSTTFANVPLNWSIVQTGDYNGDGKSDILWFDTSGDVGVWFMNGTTVLQGYAFGNVGTNWSVQSLGAE